MSTGILPQPLWHPPAPPAPPRPAPPPCEPDAEQWNRDSPGDRLAPPPEGKEGGVGEVRIGQAGGGRARGGEGPMGIEGVRG